MNAFWQWLRLPWLATLRAQRILVLTLQLCLLAGALAARLVLAAGDGRLQTPLVLLAFAAGLWWMTVGARWLLVMQDARTLRLPRTRARTGGSLASAVAQSLLLPAVLMACLGAPFASSALLLADVSLIAGLLWGLLPRYLALFAALLPSAAIFLSGYLGWPSITDAAFAPLGAELAVLGLLLVALRIDQLRRAPDREYSRWTIPMALLLRGQQGVFEGLPRGPQCNLRGPAQGTASLDVDFDAWEKPRAADPRTDCRLIRMVLGPPFAPRRARIELRDWGLGIITMAALELVGWRLLPLDMLRAVNAVILLLLPALGLWVLPALASRRLIALFGKQPAAEVALLAHLPGLGDATRARSLLLRATLGEGLRRYAIAVLLMIAAWLLLVGQPQVVPWLLVAALILAALMCYVMLGALAGVNLEDRSTRYIVRAAIYFGVLIPLLYLSGFELIPLITLPIAHKSTAHLLVTKFPWILAALAAAWSGVLVFALTRLRRNWRRFQRRPHPFMQR